LIPKRLEKLCEEFMRRGLHEKMQWFAMLRANQMKLDLLKLMKEAGCFYVDFGAESGNSRVLKVLNKGTTLSDNLNATEAAKEADLLLGTSVILGSPTETEDEIKDTIDFCKVISTANKPRLCI